MLKMVIMLGDNAYNAGTEAEHNIKFFNIYDNNVFDNHVIFPVPGNHEYANDRTRAIDHNIPYIQHFHRTCQCRVWWIGFRNGALLLVRLW